MPTSQSLTRRQQVRPFNNSTDADIGIYSLLQGVIESLVDGILILTNEGDVIHANSTARRICMQLVGDTSSEQPVPQQIWHICQVLMESRELFPDQAVIIEDEISISKPVTIRIRARWLELSDGTRPCLLLTLENRYESAKNMAIAEAKKYGLTERETQVWLLKRAGYTYKAIAAELHIAVDTVKKHLKNIHARRDAMQWEDWEE
ncbi:helix-turn-helix transcriptional regulator [Oculatella sp. LEGE 06141]|nr:helix-turn-helix transcriptional regulator [Oculatella sp. LEGE 06141]